MRKVRTMAKPANPDPELSAIALRSCLIARDAVVNMAEALSNGSAIAFMTVAECETELDDIDSHVDSIIAGRLADAEAQQIPELLACLKFILDLERIGDLVSSLVSRFRQVRPHVSRADVEDLIRMCGVLEQMLVRVEEAFRKHDSNLAISAFQLDAEMDRLRTEIYSRQVRSGASADLSTSLQVFAMAQALERAGDHAKNLAEEVCHLVQGTSHRHAHTDERGKPVPSVAPSATSSRAVAPASRARAAASASGKAGARSKTR